MDVSNLREWERALSATRFSGSSGEAEASLTTPKEVTNSSKRTQTAVDLVRDALDHRRGLLAYQPVFSARHRATPAFYEGLTRIFTKEGKLIPARDFIYEVDCSVIGREIDCLSLELSLRTLEEQPDLRLSVNVSARSILYPRWNKTLRHWLEKDPYIGERLILEISESSAMMLPELVSVFMRECQADGISFALDYFGSGSMSFRHMREFNFDIVKFDGEFVRNIAADSNNQTMLKALLFVAQNFDMLTVAVSVENEEDARYLTEMDVDCLQGFHLGAPTVNPVWLKSQGASGHG